MFEIAERLAQAYEWKYTTEIIMLMMSYIFWFMLILFSLKVVAKAFVESYKEIHQAEFDKKKDSPAK